MQDTLDNSQIATLDKTTIASFFEWIAEGKSQKQFVAEYNANKPETLQPLTIGKLRRMILEDGEETYTQYELAKRFHADSLVDEMVGIADEVDSLLGVAVANVKLTTRKWVAERYNHKAYGNKIEQQHSLAPGSKPLTEIVVHAVPAGHFIKSDDESVDD